MRLTLAAAGAVIAALLQLTIVPYIRIGDAQPELVLVFAVVATTAGTVEAGLISAFIGGLMIDALAPRPLGMTAFMLVLSVGVTAVLARVFDRVRYLVPIVAVFLTSLMSSALYVAPLQRPPRADHRGRPGPGDAADGALQHGGRCRGRTARHRDPPAHGRAGARRVVAPAIVDERPTRERQLVRFLAFGIAVLIGVSGLTARLVYLQFVRGQVYQARAEQNRTVTEALPSTRGLIYDRKGRLLVTNEPSYAIKIRPADLPFSKRDEVVARLSALLGIDQADINMTIDANPGSRFDLVRVAQDVPIATANLIAEERLALPGVEVAVESKRHYTDGPLTSQIIGYTGAIDADTLKALKDQGYQPDDLIGQAGVESSYESTLRGVYGQETIERDATGRKLQVLSTDREAQPGDSLVLTIDSKEQRLAEKAVTWAMNRANLKRGVMIVMNPQTGEILAMVSLPTYDNNKFAEGISRKDFQKLLKNPEKPLLNHAINEQFPPGSTYKLVTGLGVLADKKLGPTELVQTKPYIQIGPDKFWDWNHAGFGRLDIRSGFAHSSDTFFYQMAQRLGIERLAYWAHQLGFGAKTGIDLPGEVPGIVPTNQWKQDTFGQPIFPGEVLQAGIGQGYDTTTPLQILNAYAALANGGRLYQPQVVREIVDADGTVVRPFAPKLIRKVKTSAENFKIMRIGAREVVTSGHTFNLRDLPIVVAGKTGTAEFGVRDSKGLLPFHNWFVAFVPKHRNVARPDSELAVIGFAYDSNTVGNTATEMVKYYLQLHFHLKHDLRRFDLLRKGNFYGGN